jgi:hypothetical protein
MAGQAPLFAQFAGLLNDAIDREDGETLCRLLPIEPPFNADYARLLDEVYAVFDDDDVFKECIQGEIAVIASDDKDAWYAFADFLVTYFDFIRHVNIEDLLRTYSQLENLIT